MKKKGVYLSGLALVSGTMASNVINFVFNVYLGRALSLSAFGELSLFTSLLYLTSIPLGSFSSTLAHSIAHLYGRYSKKEAQGYVRFMLERTTLYGIILSVLWAVASPYLSSFFHIGSPLLMLLFAPLWFVGVSSSNFSGYMKGTLAFGKIAVLNIVEALTRLIAAYLLIRYGWFQHIVLSVVISLTISMVIGWFFVHDSEPAELAQHDKKFNILFFSTSVLNGISVIAFLTLDVILVKHFLSADAAGEYGLLSLIGKMTYFLGSLFGPFMIPLVSHNEGAKKDSKRTFLFLFAVTFIFSVCSFIGLGLLGHYIVPIIFGPKTRTILDLLIPYVMAMALFTITQPIVSYFQAKQQYSFAIVGFLIAILQIVLTTLFHANLGQIVWVMLSTSVANLVFMGVLYMFGGTINAAFQRSKQSVRVAAYDKS